MKQAAILLTLSAVHLAITLVPSAAAVVACSRVGVRRPVTLVAAAMVGAGLAALTSLWAYYADPRFGRAWSWGLLILGLAVSAWWRSAWKESAVRALVWPLSLWVVGTWFILFLGYLHGGTETGLTVSLTRFTHPLPIDNYLPYYFSEQVAAFGHHHHLQPIAGWLSSDRPPLQWGFALAQRAPATHAGSLLQYQILGVTLQAMWIPAFWACLAAGRVRPWTSVLTMCALLVSDTTIVNGFYVWPKLLSAAYALMALALVIDSPGQALRRPGPAFLVGSLAAMSVLAHGVALFALLPLGVLALTRARPAWRATAAAMLAAGVVLTPWVAYQRLIDPPGDRLINYHFADEPDRSGGALGEVVSAYRKADPVAMLGVKRDNFLYLAGGSDVRATYAAQFDQLRAGDLSAALVTAREQRFFFFLPSLGIMLVSPFVMIALWKRRTRLREEWRMAVTLWFLVVSCSLFWALLVFSPEKTALHVGTSALPLWAIAAAVIGLCAVSRWLALAVTAVHVVIVLALYIPVLTPLPGTEFSLIALFMIVVTLPAFAWLSGRALPGVDLSESPPLTDPA